jgi:hypothetical protein
MSSMLAKATRPGALRGVAPKALTRGQRAYVCTMYALGETPARLAHGYGVSHERIRRVVVAGGVKAASAQSPGLAALLRPVARYAETLVPLEPEDGTAVPPAAARLMALANSGSLGRTFDLAHQRTVIESVGLDPNLVHEHLVAARLPVEATLCSAAGISVAEASRGGGYAALGAVRTLAALRGFNV